MPLRFQKVPRHHVFPGVDGEDAASRSTQEAKSHGRSETQDHLQNQAHARRGIETYAFNGAGAVLQGRALQRNFMVGMAVVTVMRAFV